MDEASIIHKLIEKSIDEIRRGESENFEILLEEAKIKYGLQNFKNTQNIYKTPKMNEINENNIIQCKRNKSRH